MADKADEKGNKAEDAKDEINTESAEEKKVESANDVPKIDLAKFFYIIGQIDIILKSDTTLNVGSLPYPYNEVPSGEFSIRIGTELPVLFSVESIGDNHTPWIRTEFLKINDFASFGEYIVASWDLMMKQLHQGSEIILTPKSTYWTVRNPDPSQLGYPIKLLTSANADVIALTDLMVRNIQLREVDNFVCQANVCGDLVPLQISAALMEYSRLVMPAIRNIMQRFLDLVSANERSSSTLRTSTYVNYFTPLCDFRLAPFMYDGLALYVGLAYDLTLKTIAPEVPIVPINDSVIIKQSQSSSTRSGFLSDIIATQYNPSMATDFVSIMSTLLTPGYIRIDVDWSDVPSEAVELQGFIAILCKAIFMYSDNPLSSITQESAYRIEERIAAVGTRNQIFVRARRPLGLFPLDDVDVNPGKLEPQVLAQFRTDGTGAGWMNSNRQIRADDGFGGIYEGEMEMRPVFAVDCSDYVQFTENEDRWKGEWAIYRVIEGFSFAWNKRNKALSEIMLMYLTNILQFLIRMNEYNSRNYYTGLRLPENLVRQLIGENRNRNCVHVSVRAKSVLAFAKSVGHDVAFKRKTSVMTQFRIESQIVKTLMYLRMAYLHVVGVITEFGIDDEYGRQKIWSIVCQLVKHIGPSPLLTHLEMLAVRRLLGSLPRTYGLAVTDNQLYRDVLARLLAERERNPLRYGFSPYYMYRKVNYRIRNMHELRRLATGMVEVPNVERYGPGPYPLITIRGQIRPWMRACAAAFNLETQSIADFIEVRVPIGIQLQFARENDLHIIWKKIHSDFKEYVNKTTKTIVNTI